MNAMEFCYWLRGAIELGQKSFTEEQVKIIDKHLDLAIGVKTKETPMGWVNPLEFDDNTIRLNEHTPYASC